MVARLVVDAGVLPTTFAAPAPTQPMEQCMRSLISLAGFGVFLTAAACGGSGSGATPSSPQPSAPTGTTSGSGATPVSAGTVAAANGGQSAPAGGAGFSGTSAAGAAGAPTSVGSGTGGNPSGGPAAAGGGGVMTPEAGSGGTSASAPGASDGGTAPGAAGAGGTSAPTGSAFPPATDFSVDGPYTGKTLDATGPNSNYTVYLPTELAPGGAKNPIVGWMSGGGTTASLYPLLPRLATHGFVVVASNSIPGIGDEINLGQEILAGIKWALDENGRAESELFEKLDTTKIASVGYSMGSLATFTIASDPLLTTTVHISGGNMAPERIMNLQKPAAFFCGIPGGAECTDLLSSTCDIAASNCDLDFEGATGPVFYGNFDSGHLGILTPPYQEQIQTEVVAWLRWQLMGDAAVKGRFVGEQCTVCQDSKWKVKQKNLQ
ncbi:MAG: hypothetical protein ABW321_18835 [Polyangiales bacterium]